MTNILSSTALLIDAYRNGPDLMVVLTGRLVLENCNEVRTRVTKMLEPEIERLYIFMGQLKFVDSAGWGAMVGIKMAATKNRTRLAFVSPPAQVLEVFKISKLDSIFEVLLGSEAESIAQAIARPEFQTLNESGLMNSEAQASKSSVPKVINPEDKAGDSAGALPDDIRREIETLCRDALEQLRNGAFQQAVDLYKRVLELDPDDLTALNNLGVVYEKRPEWRNDAVLTWKRVLELSEQRRDPRHGERARKHLTFLERLG